MKIINFPSSDDNYEDEFFSHEIDLTLIRNVHIISVMRTVGGKDLDFRIFLPKQGYILTDGNAFRSKSNSRHGFSL